MMEDMISDDENKWHGLLEKEGTKLYHHSEEVLDIFGTVSPHHGPRREYPEGKILRGEGKQ
jgi:hypothetical protein